MLRSHRQNLRSEISTTEPTDIPWHSSVDKFDAPHPQCEHLIGNCDGDVVCQFFEGEVPPLDGLGHLGDANHTAGAAAVAGDEVDEPGFLTSDEPVMGTNKHSPNCRTQL